MVDLLGPDATVTGEGHELDGFQRASLGSRAETMTYGGANEIQRNILGERVLGLPREA